MAEVAGGGAQVTGSAAPSSGSTNGGDPQKAFAELCAELCQALALSAANAVALQQQTNILGSAIVAKAVSALIDSAELAPASASSHAVASSGKPIVEALAAIDRSLADGVDCGIVTAAAYEAIAQTVVLTVQNAVAQQQQAFLLKNALTAAAAVAVMNGKKTEAEAVELARELGALLTPDVASALGEAVATLRAISTILRNTPEAVSA